MSFLEFSSRILNFLNFDKKNRTQHVHFLHQWVILKSRSIKNQQNHNLWSIKLLRNGHFSHFWPKLVIFGSISDRVLKILETSFDKLDVLIQNFQSDYLNLQTSIFSFNCNIPDEIIFSLKIIFSKKNY